MGGWALACLVVVEMLVVSAGELGSDSKQPNPMVVISEEAKPPIASKALHSDDALTSSSDPAETEPRETAAAPDIRRLGNHLTSPEKAWVAGGVIMGGLAVILVFAAVYCYIHVTRKGGGDHQETTKLSLNQIK